MNELRLISIHWNGKDKDGTLGWTCVWGNNDGPRRNNLNDFTRYRSLHQYLLIFRLAISIK